MNRAIRSFPPFCAKGRGALLQLLLLLLLTSPAAAAQQTSNKNLTFGIINGGSPFFEPVAAGFERRCGELGITSYVRVASPPPENPGQPCWEVRRALVREYIALGVDAIAFKPCGPDQEMPSLFEEMEQAGIPVVTIDSDVLEVPVKRLAYIGTDNLVCCCFLLRKQLFLIVWCSFLITFFSCWLVLLTPRASVLGTHAGQTLASTAT